MKIKESQMSKEELAKLLNGREYPNEITYLERAQAKEQGLVVLIGGSDDLACFHGAIEDEADCVGGGDIFVMPGGVLEAHDDCDCKFCGIKDAKEKARKVEAVWDEEGYSWVYKTDIPHASFDVMEDGGKYCRGIVFSISDLEVAAHA
jgi:hypothetical protein